MSFSTSDSLIFAQRCSFSRVFRRDMETYHQDHRLHPNPNTRLSKQYQTRRSKKCQHSYFHYRLYEKKEKRSFVTHHIPAQERNSTTDPLPQQTTYHEDHTNFYPEDPYEDHLVIHRFVYILGWRSSFFCRGERRRRHAKDKGLGRE